MFKMSLYFLVLLELSVTHALQCYNCSGISDVEECLTVTDCRSGQSCYMENGASGQTSTLGCTDNQRCGVHASGVGSLVGRDLTSRQQNACFECCSKDDCNKNLCAHLKLDGHWAEWTSWSGCDVTCAKGTRTRTRTCTNPSPANGGLDCAGSSTDTQTCQKELCPVHGGWTKWGPWDDCSVTCGAGLQKRHRNCSNPAPSRFGDHCYGDTLDVRMCSPAPCALHGGWGKWGSWEGCSVTCGAGLQKRHRNCSNPVPSRFGDHCYGDTQDVRMCSPAPCAPKNIVFLAHTVKDITPSNGQTMIFGTVIENAGHAYSTSTGVFTAPVNGTYSFSSQFCVYTGKHMFVAIVVDGVIYDTNDVYDKTEYTCDSTSTVAVLHANAKVWVKSTSVSGSGTIIHQDVTYYMNTFSGYLIHQ